MAIHAWSAHLLVGCPNYAHAKLARVPSTNHSRQLSYIGRNACHFRSNCFLAKMVKRGTLLALRRHIKRLEMHLHGVRRSSKVVSELLMKVPPHSNNCNAFSRTSDNWQASNAALTTVTKSNRSYLMELRRIVGSLRRKTDHVKQPIFCQTTNPEFACEYSFQQLNRVIYINMNVSVA